jgi:hypothetical protein
MAAEPGGLGEPFPLKPRPGVVAACAVLLAFAWQAFQVHALFGGNWTALFYVSTRAGLPDGLRAHTYLRSVASDYDGQYHRLMAYDPWPPFRWNRFLDNPPCRRPRMLVSTLAWVLTLRRRAWIDHAYVAVVLLSLALGVGVTARGFALHGRSPWWGLGFLLLPASLASMDRLLIDATLAALVFAAVLARMEGRWLWCWTALVLAGLIRELGFLVAGTLARLLAGEALGEGRDPAFGGRAGAGLACHHHALGAGDAPLGFHVGLLGCWHCSGSALAACRA